MESSEDTIDEHDYAGRNDEGWIRLSRKDSWVWHYSHAIIVVWLYLLRKANYKDQLWKRSILVKRGQRITSYAKIAEYCKLTYDQARTCIRVLKEHGSITTAKIPPSILLVTICNYDLYQGDFQAKSQLKSQLDPNLIPTRSQLDPNLIPTNKEGSIREKKEGEGNKKGEEGARPSASTPPPVASPPPVGIHPEAVVPQKSPDDEVPPVHRIKHNQTHISQAPKWALPFIAVFAEMRNGDKWYDWRKDGCGGIFQDLVHAHGELKVVEHFRNALSFPDWRFLVKPFAFSQEFSRFDKPYSGGTQVTTIPPADESKLDKKIRLCEETVAKRGVDPLYRSSVQKTLDELRAEKARQQKETVT
jgi:hypothetical protein